MSSVVCNPDMPGALAAKAIDAYFVGEPHAAKAELDGSGWVLYLAKDIWPHFISCVLVVHERLIQSRPVVSSGTLLLQLQGPLAAEDDVINSNFPRKSEEAVLEIVSRVGGAPPTLGACRRRSRVCPASHRHRARKERFGICG